MSTSPTRRTALATGAALAAGLASRTISAQQPTEKPVHRRLAAVNSIFYKNSHAYHILGRFLYGYTKDGKLHKPLFDIERMWNDQYQTSGTMKDRSKAMAKEKNITITETIPEALGGVGTVDVDGVLLIAEHGDYSRNDRGQIQYPRYEWWEQIRETLEKSNKKIPVFIDKAFSFDARLVKEMFAGALKLGIPLFAGSSLPVTWRKPEWEPELAAKITEAVVVFHGDMEIYGFHALEVLQCLLERRKGGETGVRALQTLKGPDVWRHWARGTWDKDLTEAALRRSPSRDFGEPRDHVENPVAFRVEYTDGTIATLLNLPGYISDITAAVRISGDPKPQAVQFVLPPPPGARFFNPLVHYIEDFMTTGKAPWPVERTVLTSIMLDYLHISAAEGGKVFPTKDLEKVTYLQPKESFFFRNSASDD